MAIYLKDSIIRAYEEYVLKNKNVEEGLKSLVAGSESYNYLKCIDLLNKKGVDLSEKEQEFIDDFASSTEFSDSRKVELRRLFLSYDAASKEEKGRILDTLNSKFLKCQFDHQKPLGRNGSSEESKGEEKEKEQEKVLDEVDLKGELQKLYEGILNPRSFSKEALASVDFTLLGKEQFDALLAHMGADILLLDGNKNFYSTFGRFYGKKRARTTKSESFNSSIIQYMTIDQLDKLQKEIPELEKYEYFIDLYFAKKFSRELSIEENAHLDHREKRRNLIKMYDYAKKLPEKLSGLKSVLLLEILENGLKTGAYEEEYFIQYLKHPARRTYVKKYEIADLGIWKRRIQNVQDKSVARNRGRAVLTAYLEYFFLKGAGMRKYSDFIEQSFLTEVWEDTMLISGKKIAFTHTNAERLEKLATDVRITIAPQNKELFKIGEDISIWVSIKNVPKLFIKVFEINTENYYRKNMSAFKTDINLDGLVASIERTQEFTASPQIKFLEEIKFPELKGRVGLYVIELIGNGRSSRAIVKIGTLSVVTQQTAAGQYCYVLDGEHKICQDETTGIWMDNQYFKANLEKKGRIMVPYLPSSGEKLTKAILLHKGLAQLVDMRRTEERYTLTCGFYLLPESVLMGKSTTMLARPQLLVNGRHASLKLLRNIRCTLHTRTFVDSISSSKTFSGLALSDDNELVLEFQVPANLDSMKVTFYADVQNISKNTTETLSSSENFKFTNYADSHSIFEFYLRLDQNKDYVLYLLGKNGEPIKNTAVNFSIKTSLFSHNINKKAVTNSQGAIKLGKLKNVEKVNTSIPYGSAVSSISKTWHIPSLSLMQYPEIIDVIEGQTVEMPISAEHINSKLLLKSVSNDMNLENFSSAIKIEKNKDELYGMVSIKGLPSGDYCLTGIGNCTTTIKVNKGTYWSENNGYILKKYSLLENHQNYGFIKIKSVKFEEEKDGKALMKIAVDGATKNRWRVHVMLFRFLPENLDGLTLKLLSKDDFLGAEHFFQKWANFYLSDRELSSEYRYCFDRRHQPKFIGNTLEKPKLILRRTLVQVTHTREGVVAKGTEYTSQQEDYIQAKQALVSAGQERARCPHSRPAGLSQDTNVISAYQNFLAQEPVILANLPANGEGTIAVEIESSFRESFGCALILAVDKGSVAHHVQPLGGDKAQRRDLSLTKPLDAGKAYSEMRTAKCVQKLETFEVENMTSTDVQIVDSLEKVMLVIGELITVFYARTPDFSGLEKLVQWQDLAEEEKNKMMSRFASHELNLFTYKKDPEYFDRVVKPFVQNKMQKTFMDHYLLGDMSKMNTYASSLLKLEKLNVLEKALLVEILALNGKVKAAQAIARMMQDKLQSQKKNIPEQIKMFDTVLSLGSLKEAKGGILGGTLVETRELRDLAADNTVLVVGKGSGGSGGRGGRGSRSRGRKLSETVMQPRSKPEVLSESEEPCEEEDEDLMSVSSESEASNLSCMQERKELKVKPEPHVEEREAKEYCESNYFNNTSGRSENEVVLSGFWVDYALACLSGKKPANFLSHHFTSAYHSLIELAGVISLLDLPQKSVEHGFKANELRGAKLKAASNLIVFQKVVKECEESINNNILVAQNYVDIEASKNSSSGPIEVKPDEFLVNKIYKGQAIITNVSSQRLDCDVLLQIPENSLPIGRTLYQRSHPLSLESYATKKFEYEFYFPAPGNFAHFPASVSVNSVVVAKSRDAALAVRKQKVRISEKNFGDVISTGNHELILNFVKENPVGLTHEFPLSNLYWLLTDKAFYDKLIDILMEKCVFDHVTWSFSLYHKHREDVVREFLDSLLWLKENIGCYFSSGLIKVRPSDSAMAHLDYYPIINPRAHKNAHATSSTLAQPLILNEQFYNTYKKFIIYLIEKPSWNFADKLTLTYYLLLQDRIQDALQVFGTASKEEVAKENRLQLQYDYMAAYLDFYTGGPEFKLAREIVRKYLDYPIISWRLLFIDIEQQLKEYDGEHVEEMEIDEEERKEMGQKKKIQEEAQLDIALDGKEVLVSYSKVSEILVKYYVIDLEMLFSRAPFLARSTEDFSYVQPSSSASVPLSPERREHRLLIPHIYSTKNIVIEVNGGGFQRLVTYFSTSLKLQVFENYGELKVTDEAGQQLSQVYVKAFIQKKDGGVMFYKDGYTDIRGRFDYVSLNASQIEKASRFAIFVTSDTHGSLIKECQPPATVVKAEEDIGPMKASLANYYKKKYSSKT